MAEVTGEALLRVLENLPLPMLKARPSHRPAVRGVDRFAWHLIRQTGGLAVDVLACAETPKGWREGDRIPPQRLPSPGSSLWGDLGEGERSALTALALWRRKPGGIPFPLLAALEGHTRLSWAEGLGQAPERVALAREVAALEVRESPGGWILRLSHRGGRTPAHLALKDGHRLVFTGFAPFHQHLDTIFGEGKEIGRTQGGRLARILSRLAPQIPLVSDLMPEPRIAEAPPSRCLLVWAKGGGERLEVRLRVRPAPGLALELPGSGAAFTVAGEPHARRLWRRDFLLERKRAEQVEALLPTSARRLSSPFSWCVEGRVEVATFLAGLRELGSGIELNGVPGLAPRFPERAVLEDIRVSLRERKGGFELRGTLRGMPLEDILPSLRGPMRFLGLESGGLLDLSGLPSPHLRALALWGQAKAGGILLPAQAAPSLRSLGIASLPAPLPAGLPTDFHGELRPYQLEGFRWMANLLDGGLGACLADDMGLGKTVQTAAVLLHRSEIGPALVVCPTSLVLNWSAELARFAPGLAVRRLGEGDRAEMLRRVTRGQVVLCSYGLLLSESESLQAVEWGTVVLDEAHAIKNFRTQRAQASRLLKARGRLALTGTPVENRPEELGSLLSWLLPGSEARFASADPETLRSLSGPFLLRRRKSEVLKELPPRTDLTIQVELEAQEADFHKDLRERCRDEVREGGVMQVLAALMKLRRACAHPGLVDPGYRGPAAKMELLLDRLATMESEGRQSLVFSQFTDLLDLLEARLREEGIAFCRLDGSMPPRARQRAVEGFQDGEASVFLLSLKAGGTGLNLTAADEVFHMDPWWNPAVEDQASDRAHRMGRSGPVTVHRLVAVGTVEERVLALHAGKRAMVEHLLEGRSQDTALDRETLEALLG